MQANQTASPASRILRIRQVLDMTGLRRTALYEKINASEFPKPVKLGVRAVGWREGDVLSWMDSLMPSEGGHHG
jgi:prophage regulatory protein